MERNKIVGIRHCVSCVSLAVLQYLVVLSNVNVGCAVQVVCGCGWHRQLVDSESRDDRWWGGWASSSLLKAFRAKTEISGRRRNSILRFQHQPLPECLSRWPALWFSAVPAPQPGESARSTCVCLIYLLCFLGEPRGTRGLIQRVVLEQHHLNGTVSESVPGFLELVPESDLF